MDNIIWKELSEDDLIFKIGFVLSSPTLQTGPKQQAHAFCTISNFALSEQRLHIHNFQIEKHHDKKLVRRH